MVRIYLDWNIISSLRNSSVNDDPYKVLERILINNSDKILILYSSAHLTDLIVSYNQSESGKQQTKLDLDYLEKLTNNHCLLYDYRSQRTYPDQVLIQNYFDDLLKSEDMHSGSFDNFLESFENIETKEILNSIVPILKDIPSGIDPNSFDLLPKSFQVLKETYCFGSNQITMHDMIQSTFNLLSQFYGDHNMYKNLRNALLNEIKLSLDYSKCNNPIAEISKRLERSEIGKSYEIFAKDNLKTQFKDKEPSQFDVFTNHFILLDMFGYFKDNKMRNLIQDSFHAYYGAHCDFFVTDDNNTYHKAKTLYKYLNIGTIVCKSGEFINEYFNRVILNDKSLIDSINQSLKSALIVDIKLDENMYPVRIYKLNYYILNFFNRIQLRYFNSQKYVIHLYKESQNYSSFFFILEFEKIVNKITLEFGIDESGKGLYCPDIENEEIYKKEWKGRLWRIDNQVFSLYMTPHPDIVLSIKN